ncbi:hypothetical protein HG535_0D01340 [Zygotorulaspora mrakii]|uniref:Autophagy-related protein 16 domain-containing protein n=1 Tax=Zygotorulaspora mrakii TaxID=42260 RepID=A0A7H9B1W4_ZYGMR|nr:uncharacterized protein HG535_0D01340 [Zygotorulaspora mrakii]QLG72426.1 hypothetical protein HG535_0D01340 [Zygotorulaspora mrakii]
MDQGYITKLQDRDVIESRFCDLFRDVPIALRDEDINATKQNNLKSTVNRLRKELKDKDAEVRSLREVIKVKNNDSEKLNNELISLNIENNLVGHKYAQLEEEHEKLVKRWLERVHQEFDVLNAR